MAGFAERVRSARHAARDPRIIVTGIEAELGTNLTAGTLQALTARLGRPPIWLMGADNLMQIDHWSRWQTIFQTVPVVVFDRPRYAHKAMRHKAAQRYSRARQGRPGVTLARRKPPAWSFLHGRLVDISATAIRRRRKSEETH